MIFRGVAAFWGGGLFLAQAMCAGSSSAAPSDLACTRYALEGLESSWVTSASRTTRELLLADAGLGGVWRISFATDGDIPQSLEFLQHPGRGATALNGPLSIHGLETGFLVSEARWPKLVWLDPTLSPKASIDLMQSRTVESRVTLVLQWAVADRSGDFVGFGFVGPAQQPGFFLRQAGAQLGVEAAVRPLDLATPKTATQFYLTLPSAASGPSSVYFWFQDDAPKILRFSGDRYELLPVVSSTMKGVYRGMLPTGRPGRSVGTLARDYAELAETLLPVQLLVFGERLHVVYRSSADPSDPRWTLIELEVLQSGVSEVASWRLPSKAPWVLLAATDQRLTLIEKGSVNSAGRQPVDAVVALPIPDRGQRWAQQCSAGEVLRRGSR